ncbi:MULTISPECIES: MipA/OmpV family protein [Aliivibrio]|uniref:MipA/OmpV family protein n=1 Tax=Aliivibrio TaxID=511678 RepID=UPI0026BF4568
MNKLVNGLIVGAAYSPSFYKETPSNTTVIPVVGYEGEHLFLRGFSGGYRLYPVGTPQNIILRFVYDPRTFKPEDSDNIQMQKLDERKATILGGVTYQAITHIGLSTYFHLTSNIRVTGDLRYVNLEGNLEKSSMIEHTASTTGNVGIAYVF